MRRNAKNVATYGAANFKATQISGKESFMAANNDFRCEGKIGKEFNFGWREVLKREKK